MKRDYLFSITEVREKFATIHFKLINLEILRIQRIILKLLKLMTQKQPMQTVEVNLV